MNLYRVSAVGGPANPVVEVEAHSHFAAVAQVARCDFGDVGLPIWTKRHFGNPHWAPIAAECFMPRDGSGCQWLVTPV